MKFSLIAMSGSGKSYWSTKLANRGFRHFDCDRMIASKFGPVLTRSDGSVLSLGEWMGFPYQPGYQKREAQYLEIAFEMKDQMLRAYRADPRPVLWQGKFVRKPQEKIADALARCYPELLAERERLYKRYAHISIPSSQYRQRGWGVVDFLDAIKMRKQR